MVTQDSTLDRRGQEKWTSKYAIVDSSTMSQCWIEMNPARDNKDSWGTT